MAEGTPYGLWYNEFYVPAFDALRMTADFDLWKRPFFRKVRYFFFYCTAVRGEIRPFGDSAEKGGRAYRAGAGTRRCCGTTPTGLTIPIWACG